MKTLPFDPADYLDSEEEIAAYLADARLDGEEAVADALEVVARARARMGASASDKNVAASLSPRLLPD